MTEKSDSAAGQTGPRRKTQHLNTGLRRRMLGAIGPAPEGGVSAKGMLNVGPLVSLRSWVRGEAIGFECNNVWVILST